LVGGSHNKEPKDPENHANDKNKNLGESEQILIFFLQNQLSLRHRPRRQDRATKRLWDESNPSKGIIKQIVP